MDDSSSQPSFEYLFRVQEHLASEGVHVEIEVIGGVPAPAILEYASTHDIDLIVIGSRGYTGMKRLLLGSVASEVLSKSRCPVLLIPSE
jgi:nucleotide-binding universal stress UspA family protein